MALTTGLRTPLPTDRTGLRGGGTVIENPIEIVDRLDLPAELPVSSGLSSSGDIYIRRDRLDRNSPATPSQIPDTLSGANSVIPYILGEVRTVALPFYVYRSARDYHFVYIVGEGEIDSYRTIWIDGVETDISAQAIETAFGVSAVDATASCTLYVGNGTQDVSTSFSTVYPTYSDTLEDFAVIYLRLPSRVIQRPPRVEVKVRGKQIKDYSDSQTVKYTANAGNLLVHWVEVVEGRTVDATSAQAISDACAEVVGTGVRREAGFAFNRPVSAAQTRSVLQAHAACWIIDSGSAVRFVPDRPASSVMDIDESMILGDVSINTASLRNQPDDVIINWQDPDTGITQQARAQGTVSDRPSNVQMVGIHDAAQAKREAIERYNHLNLERDTISFEVTAKGLRLEPGDVFRITHAPTGLSLKSYRATNIEARFGKAQITAREYQPSVYSDSTSTDGLIPDTDLPSPLDIPTVAGLTLTAENKVVDCSIENQIAMSWTDPAWPFIALFTIDVFNNDVTPQTLEYQMTVAADKTSAVIPSLLGGTEYECKIRIQSTQGPYGVFASGFERTFHRALSSRYEMETTAGTDSIGTQDLTPNDSGNLSLVTGKVGTNAVEIDNSAVGALNAGFSTTSTCAAAFVPPWTIRGWFRMTNNEGVGNNTYLLYQNKNVLNPVFNLSVRESNELYLSWRVPPEALNELATGLTMTLNTWHFIVIQYYGGGFVLTLDDGAAINVQTDIARGEADYTFGIGGGLSGTVEVDQIEVFRAALNGEELQSIYDAEK